MHPINEHSEARGLFHGRRGDDERRRGDDERHRRLRQREGVEVDPVSPSDTTIDLFPQKNLKPNRSTFWAKFLARMANLATLDLGYNSRLIRTAQSVAVQAWLQACEDDPACTFCDR